MEETGSKCIEISNKPNQDGYVRVHTYRNGVRMLHHLVWIKENGQIPNGYEIHHVCHNRACQNINHLECIDGSLHATISNNERDFKIGDWRRNGTD